MTIHQLLRFSKSIGVYDRFVYALDITYLAYIYRVGQGLDYHRGRFPRSVSIGIALSEVSGYIEYRFPFEIHLKNLADLIRFTVRDKLTVFIIVADGRSAGTMPEALFSSPLHAHLHPFRNLRPLELCERGKYAHHSYADRGGGVKTLLHRYKRTTGRSKYILDEVECVLLRAGESIQFIDQHDIIKFGILHQLLESRALHIATRKTGVSINAEKIPILRRTVGLETFGLLAYRVALVSLFVRADTDVACDVH